MFSFTGNKNSIAGNGGNYFYGKAGGPYNVLLTTDTVFPQSTSLPQSVRYRVVNLSYDAPALDIHQDARENPAVVTDLSYGTASGYVPSKDYPFGKGTGLFITQAGKPELPGVPGVVRGRSFQGSYIRVLVHAQALDQTVVAHARADSYAEFEPGTDVVLDCDHSKILYLD